MICGGLFFLWMCKHTHPLYILHRHKIIKREAFPKKPPACYQILNSIARTTIHLDGKLLGIKLDDIYPFYNYI